MMQFAGLPRPVANCRVADDPDAPISDLWLPEWRVSVEYEGSQHFTDPLQVRRDIGRYAWMRRRSADYVQITNDMRRQPRAMVLAVHAKLTERGFSGPAPDFGATWRLLFQPCPRRNVPHQPATGGRSASNLTKPA